MTITFCIITTVVSIIVGSVLIVVRTIAVVLLPFLALLLSIIIDRTAHRMLFMTRQLKAVLSWLGYWLNPV